MSAARSEIGSYFAWTDDVVGPDAPPPVLPAPHALFATGRGALLALAPLAPLVGAGRERGTLHLPSFFCMETARTWAAAFDLAWYRDLPGEAGPDFDTLRPAPGDVVLALNGFGIRDGAPWREWLRRHGDVTLIEDHTHDPMSRWARESTAHYALASLHKTLPLPDGAILWSPRGLPLPDPAPAPLGAALARLPAMILRGAYLRGVDIAKDTFRALERDGLNALDAEGAVAASDFSSAVLPRLDVAALRRRREANVREVLRLMGDRAWPHWAMLFVAWPEGAVPFNGVLVCRRGDIRDDLQRFLADRDIYCPVHWRQPVAGLRSGDPLAESLAARLLTIPVDFRCSADDIARIVDALAVFAEGRAPAPLAVTHWRRKETERDVG